MAVSEGLSDYDRATPANNTPAGSTAIGSDLDDHLRSIKANIRAAADWPLSAKTAAYTTLVGDVHTMIDVDASATGSVLVTLISAVTAGAGHAVGVSRSIAADGSVTTGSIDITSASGQIDGTATVSLVTAQAALMFISDGTNWRMHSRQSFASSTPGAGVIVDGGGAMKSSEVVLENVLEATTVAIFYQAAAPSLWTRVNDIDDHVLGFTTGTAGATNSATGSWTISGMSNAAVTLTAAQSGLRDHTHNVHTHTANQSVDLGSTVSVSSFPTALGEVSGTVNGGAVSASESHNHTPSSDATWRMPIAWTIRCSKDAPVAL